MLTWAGVHTPTTAYKNPAPTVVTRYQVLIAVLAIVIVIREWAIASVIADDHHNDRYGALISPWRSLW